MYIINKATMSVSQRAVLTLSDLGTCFASAIEQKLYLNHVNILTCGRHTMLGMVSRMVEQLLAEQMVGSTGRFFNNDYRAGKNQLIVFVFNYIYSTTFDKKTNHLTRGLQGVNADLLGQWCTDMFYGDMTLINMPSSKPEEKKS